MIHVDVEPHFPHDHIFIWVSSRIRSWEGHKLKDKRECSWFPVVYRTLTHLGWGSGCTSIDCRRKNIGCSWLCRFGSLQYRCSWRIDRRKQCPLTWKKASSKTLIAHCRPCAWGPGSRGWCSWCPYLLELCRFDNKSLKVAQKGKCLCSTSISRLAAEAS